MIALLVLHGFAPPCRAHQNGGEADQLLDYVQKGNLRKVKELLAKNAKLAMSKAECNWTALQMAARYGFPAIADALIAAGARHDIETASAFGKTKEVAAMLKDNPSLARAPHKPLFFAARGGHLEVVKLLLKHGADPNLGEESRNAPGSTPLTEAIQAGHYEVVKLLAEHGARWNVAIGWHFGNAFSYAINCCDARFVKLFLDRGAGASGADSSDLAPLHRTAVEGSIEKAELLLRYKAEINATTSDGATPLSFAAVLGHRKYCDFLLQRGARLDPYSACALGKMAEVSALLKTDPKRINTRDERLKRTPLFWAVHGGNEKLVELLLKRGAEVNVHAPPYSEESDAPTITDRSSSQETGPTPLHQAALQGHLLLVRLLLGKGAKVNARDEHHKTPLHLAAEKHHAAVVKLLLEKGAAPNARDDLGATPLLYGYADAACIKHLLAAKADVNASDTMGYTPLTLAAYTDATDAAELLAAHGARLDLYSACFLGKTDTARKLLTADPKAVDRPFELTVGETPLMVAARAGRVNIVRLLLERGAKWGPTRDFSPMHQAARYGWNEVIQVFLDKGVPVDALWKGTTALAEAASGTQVETVRFLLSKKANARFSSETGYPPSATALQCIRWGGPQRRSREPADGRREVEIARLLIAAEADVNAEDGFGRTPLHSAVEHGQVELVAELLAKGARVNAREHYGLTPLGLISRRDILSDEGQREAERMTKLLRDKGGKE
jgi:ankyrin repeat protein